MSLVTAEGRKVKAELARRAVELKERLNQFIAESGPVSVQRLIEQFPEETERTVRESMWLLLDEHSIRIDEKRRLVAEGDEVTFTKDEWAQITVALRHTHGGNYPLAAKTQRAWAQATE